MSNAFDRLLGAQLRRFRKLQGLTQQQLGERIGVSFQQVQKYETGVNKLNFERVVQLSALLGVPLAAWLEPAMLPGIPQPRDQRQALSLLQAYHSITKEEHRALLCTLARALAGQPAALPLTQT